MMNEKIAQQLYYFVQELRKEPVKKTLAEMKHNDQLSREEILAIQERKAISLVRHAHDNSVYYKKLFANYGIDIENIRTIQDFKKIPILTKDNLRENLKEIEVKNYAQKITIAKTSGSTGKVLKFRKDRDATAVVNATCYRGLSWHGIDVGAKEAMLWGVPVNRASRYQIRIQDYLLNRFREKEYNLTPKTLFEFYKKLKSHRPSILSGYSSMVYQFTKFVQENELNGKNLGLRVVKCTSETIHDDAFELVKTVFGCQLVVEYGSAETNIVAFSCEEGSIHLMADYVLTEFEEPEEQTLGQEYRELIVTSLYNYCCPIIRYKIGDFGVPDDGYCSCGRSLPLIKKIVGRSGATVYATNGDKFHSILFYYIFKGLQDKNTNVVKQFKIVQERKDKLVLQIVKDVNYGEHVPVYLNKVIKEKLGEGMEISYEFPESILRERSGKIRDFVSNLN